MVDCGGEKEQERTSFNVISVFHTVKVQTVRGKRDKRSGRRKTVVCTKTRRDMQDKEQRRTRNRKITVENTKRDFEGVNTM